jgi:dTMP kinase
LLAEQLQRCGIAVYLTREPGGTAEGESLRQLFFDPQADWQPLSELFLILAARHQHVIKVLKPKLAAGVWVICDRFTDSTLVYQGLLGGLPLPLLRQQNQLACDGLRPDITFLLDFALGGGATAPAGRQAVAGRARIRGWITPPVSQVFISWPLRSDRIVTGGCQPAA